VKVGGRRAGGSGHRGPCRGSCGELHHRCQPPS